MRPTNNAVPLLAALAVGVVLALGPAASPPAAADPGVLLRGTVVTMNDAGDVWPDAALWIRSGRIEAVVRAGGRLPPGARSA
ncbi:hypothetical protein ACIRO3_27105, partial [Streptomyces sp. NPDC102278]|uniref:hypothetical protein n=1 Tax=Streptomyces sp. NPDC102278 TaxID=3366152 RepID=UPI0038067E47